MPSLPRTRRFKTTRWSLVLAAGDFASPSAHTALANLCEIYWYPVYSFVRRSGYSVEDARDLTQAFFARVLEKRWFGTARPERGRFRSFLLTSLRHFLSNEHDWRTAVKRGAGKPLLPLEFDDGERRYQLEAVDRATPESMYERRWALAVLDDAMRRLAAKQLREGRQGLFERLRPFLTGDDALTSYSTLAKELNTTEGSLRVAVHRLRKQFVTVLRETIAETVEQDADVMHELRYLLDIVRR